MDSMLDTTSSGCNERIEKKQLVASLMLGMSCDLILGLSSGTVPINNNCRCRQMDVHRPCYWYHVAIVVAPLFYLFLPLVGCVRIARLLRPSIEREHSNWQRNRNPCSLPARVDGCSSSFRGGDAFTGGGSNASLHGTCPISMIGIRVGALVGLLVVLVVRHCLM
eukprot:scaffold15914_cov80-Cylindrotheca_fusiformis.AAC.1